MFMRLVTALFLLVSACSGQSEECVEVFQVDWAEMKEPGLAYRPWVRWWWPGTDVTAEQLALEVKWLAEAGFGVAEIQPIDAGLDPDASDAEMGRRLAFDTDLFYDKVRGALAAAAKHGVQLDLTLGSGWPLGGTHVGPGDRMETLLWNELSFKGPDSVIFDVGLPGQSISLLIAQTAQGFGEPMTLEWTGAEANILAVLAARMVGGERDDNPLVLDDVVWLDPESVVDLTGSMDNGKIAWDVPVGDWRVVVFFEAPDGQFVKFPALPDSAAVADHFDAQVVGESLEHLLGLRTGLDAHYGKALRGFFSDSFELVTERHFSADFLERFEAMRGYSLLPYLPVVVEPGADNHMIEASGIPVQAPFKFSDDDERIRFDYERTVSDLFIQRFIGTAGEWGEARGLAFRVQPYGIRVDVIKASGMATIPEAEQLYGGGSDLIVRLVTSGAHLYGRKLVSAESMVWSGRIHMTTPLKLKAAADKLFTSGINRILLHGMPYQKMDGYGEAGWHPFSSPFSGAGFSSHFATNSPFWKDLKTINRYLSRCQFALSQGSQETDLAVYYPYLGAPGAVARLEADGELFFNGSFPGEPESENGGLFSLLETLFGGLEETGEGAWMGKVRPELRELERAGFTWEWVNDHALATAIMGADRISVGEAEYQAIVVLKAPWMETDAAAALAGVADAGGLVASVGDRPTRQPGYHNQKTNDGLVAEKSSVFESLVGSLPTELKKRGAVPSLAVAAAGESVRWVVRRLGPRSYLIFLSNRSPEAVKLDMTVRDFCETPQWIDLFSAIRRDVHEEPDGTLQAQLAGYGSALLACGVADAGGTFGPSAFSGECQPLSTLDAWSFSAKGEDIQGGAFQTQSMGLVDWREVPELAFSSSPGVYSTVVSVSVADVGAVMLRAGWVHGAADVRVNGTMAGTLLVPPFELDVSSFLAVGDNQVEITVRPALRNRLVGYGASGQTDYATFAGDETQLLPVGLMGPVELLHCN